jgi:hypothetical protein
VSGLWRETPSFVDSYPQHMSDLLLRFGKTSIWLGGMFVPCSWLHNCYKKISVFILYLSDIMGLYCYALTLCLK